MKSLRGKRVYLRALEPEDLSFLFDVENEERNWEISNTQTPYSKHVLSQYLENAHQDIYEIKQLRLVISNYESEPLGFIDLFDCDFKNSKAGVGILIHNSDHRQLGYGKEALSLLIDYSFGPLNLHQLYCSIIEDNVNSIKLFTDQGFEKVGLKKDWIFSDGTYKNEYLLQLIHN